MISNLDESFEISADLLQMSFNLLTYAQSNLSDKQIHEIVEFLLERFSKIDKVAFEDENRKVILDPINQLMEVLEANNSIRSRESAFSNSEEAILNQAGTIRSIVNDIPTCPNSC